MKKRLKTIVRLLIAVVLLIIVCRYIDIKKTLQLMADVDGFYLVLCAILLNFDRFFMALKWSFLLDFSCRFSKIIYSLTKSYYYSLLLSPVVPSTVGEDVIRGVSVAKDGISKESLLSSIFMERILGALGQLSLAMLSLHFLSLTYSQLNSYYLYLSLGLALFFISIIVFPFLDLTKKMVEKLKEFFPRWTGLVFIRKTYKIYQDYRQKKKKIFIFFILSLIESCFSIFGIYWFFLALGVDITLWEMALTVPPALLFSKIPISVGALGVQEGFFVLFFSMVGVSSEEAITVSFLSRVVNTLAILPGCFVFWGYDTFHVNRDL